MKILIPNLIFLYWLLFLNSCAEKQKKAEKDKDTTTFTLPSLDPPLTSYPLVEGLTLPWGIVWGPDNRLWVTERYGRISHIDPENGERHTLLVLKNVAFGDPKKYPDKVITPNSGLLDIALDPDFPTKPYVYVVYCKAVHDTFCVNCLSRFTYKPDTLIDEKVIFDKVQAYSQHDAGRLLFDKTGKILFTTGDYMEDERAQEDTSLNGKILRLNTDGSIPSDNPNPKSYIWAKGFRDPEGLAFGPTGILYNSDHGPDTDDEVNIITKGGNYGWAKIRGIVDKDSELVFDKTHNIIEPIWYWTPTLAPGGIAYFHNSEYPFYDNSIFVAFLKGARLLQLKLDKTGSRVVQTHTYLQKEFGRLRSLCVAPDGRIFAATSNSDGRWSSVGTDDKIITILLPKL
jgi:glucose/arabinose dehydrogenase